MGLQERGVAERKSLKEAVMRHFLIAFVLAIAAMVQMGGRGSGARISLVRPLRLDHV